MENLLYQTNIAGKKRSRGSRSYINTGRFNRISNYFQITADKSCGDHLREDHKRELWNLKGEVVAYLSLIFILMVTFIAGIMESASIQLAKNYRRADMNRAMECVFAEYQKELLEQYEIFALDASYETGEYSENNIKDRLEYYGVTNTDQKIERIQFLTDQGCQAFYDQVTAYMESKYGVDSVKELLGITSIWSQQNEQSKDYAREESEQEEKLNGLLEEQEGSLPTEENPIEHVNELKKADILSLVVPEDKGISEKQIDSKEMLENRSLNRGYGNFADVEKESGTLSNLLYGEYLREHFKDYSSARSEKQGALDYELEYILFGKSSDRENLREVVKKLILIRFVPNYVYIQTDGEMHAEAEAVAGTLCTLLAVPEITEAAVQVILLAWAYGESIVDIRTLLAGNKVALTKSKETWQLQLSGLLKLGTQEDLSTGQDVENGQDYTEYLRMLLFLENSNTKALRTLTVIEKNLQSIYGQSYFRADLCVNRMEIESSSRLRRGIQYTYRTYYGYR